MDVRRRAKRLAVLTSVLYTWYVVTPTTTPHKYDASKYPLPHSIQVMEAEYQSHQGIEKIIRSSHLENGQAKNGNLENLVVSDIDFSKPFKIKTEKYRIVKDNDWLASRVVGHVLSIIPKIILFDNDVGLGLDAYRSKAVISMLEHGKHIKDINVRINHTEAWFDFYQLFTNRQMEERNNLVARIAIGLPNTLIGGVWGELFRGDHYNPMTRTAILYSNVESISAHEIGHHIDHQRFDRDWAYSLSRPLPPMMLFQEAQASIYAKDLLSPADKGQFERYLLPAFFTYLLGAWAASRVILQRRKHKMWKKGGFDDLPDHKRPKIKPLETLRHFTSLSTAFVGGAFAYGATIDTGAHEFIGYGAAVAGYVATLYLVAKPILQNLLPYSYETNIKSSKKYRMHP